MSDPKPKSTIRRLLEIGQTDPLLLDKLTLLEELQEAHAKGDQKTMLEIGRKLAANVEAFDKAREARRQRMKEVVGNAKAVDDPSERTKRLLAAFQFLVKEACAAQEESQDIETFNVGVRQLAIVGRALEAISPERFAELAQFLDSPNMELRGFAAVWLRHLMPERVLPILKEIDEAGVWTPVSTQVSIAILELKIAADDKHAKN